MESGANVPVTTIGFGKVRDRQSRVRIVIDCHESTGLLVEFLLVFGPERIPNHVHDTAGGTLSVDIFLERGNRNSATDNTTNGGKSVKSIG